jgi:hypothetical protein
MKYNWNVPLLSEHINIHRLGRDVCDVFSVVIRKARYSNVDVHSNDPFWIRGYRLWHNVLDFDIPPLMLFEVGMFRDRSGQVTVPVQVRRASGSSTPMPVPWGILQHDGHRLNGLPTCQARN